MPAARERVEQRLLEAAQTGDPALTEMASHLIKAGGKRVRPLFTLAAAATAGGGADLANNGDALTGGVAVELVHLGSLYHDDVIDEATTRRTVESVNARWGNLRAILAGDFLLARASELAATLGTEVAILLAATIGRLCEGEVRELQHVYRLDRTETDYFDAIEGKTAALFSTACRIGGIVAGLPAVHLEALSDFGLHYGTAFQVVDDVLDIVATDDELGKPAGHDLAEGVYNLPVLRALEGAEGADLRVLLGHPIEAEAQRQALAVVRSGSAIGESTDAAETYVKRAVEALAPLPPSPATRALAGAAEHLLSGLEGRI
jgi:heptaprenyl diphosphate synthase